VRKARGAAKRPRAAGFDVRHRCGPAREVEQLGMGDLEIDVIRRRVKRAGLPAS